MPFVTKAVRDYANFDDPGFPFGGSSIHFGGVNIISEGEDDGGGISGGAIAGIIIGVLLLLLVVLLAFWLRRRNKGSPGGPGIFQRLRAKFGGGSHGTQEVEMETKPHRQLYAGHGSQGGKLATAQDEVDF